MAQQLAALGIDQTAIATQDVISRAEVRRQLPHRDTGQDQQFAGVEDAILMSYEHNDLVPVFAPQASPPAQRTLAFQLFMAPNGYGRFGRRRVELLHAAGQVRAPLTFGFGDDTDLTGLDVKYLVDHLVDLVIRRGHHHPRLGLVPQALGEC